MNDLTQRIVVHGLGGRVQAACPKYLLRAARRALTKRRDIVALILLGRDVAFLNERTLIVWQQL